MKVSRPWGHYELLTENEKTTVKIISLHAGNRTSLQLHKHRSEKWYVLSGEGYATFKEKKKIKSGDELFVPKTTEHRLEAITDMKVLEISYGFFDELDITRIDDDYSRCLLP